MNSDCIICNKSCKGNKCYNKYKQLSLKNRCRIDETFSCEKISRLSRDVFWKKIELLSHFYLTKTSLIVHNDFYKFTTVSIKESCLSAIWRKSCTRTFLTSRTRLREDGLARTFHVSFHEVLGHGVPGTYDVFL